MQCFVIGGPRPHEKTEKELTRVLLSISAPALVLQVPISFEGACTVHGLSRSRPKEVVYQTLLNMKFIVSVG